jgi:hypothetical protein
MSDDRFGLYAVKAGATVIPAVEVSAEQNPQEWGESHSGGIDLVGMGISRIQPQVRFTTRNVAAALAACGLAGLTLSAGAPFTYWWRKRAVGDVSGGVAIGTTVHEKRVISLGLMVPMRIDAGSAGGGDRASIQYEVHAAGSPSVAPVAYDTGQAIASALPGADVFHGLGPVVLKDVDDNYIVIPTQGWSLEFGWQILKDTDTSLPYDQWVGAMGRALRLRVTSRDVTQGNALADVGTDVNWGGSPVTSEVLPETFDGLQIVEVCAYLRGLIPGGGPYVNAEEQHIQFKIVSGSVMVASERAGARGLAEIELSIPVSSDGTNDVVQIDTSAAIVTAV